MAYLDTFGQPPVDEQIASHRPQKVMASPSDAVAQEPLPVHRFFVLESCAKSGTSIAYARDRLNPHENICYGIPADGPHSFHCRVIPVEHRRGRLCHTVIKNFTGNTSRNRAIEPSLYSLDPESGDCVRRLSHSCCSDPVSPADLSCA